MRLLGRWSLASFMAFLVNLSYYSLLVIVLTVISVIVVFLGFARVRNVSTQYEVPVRFRLDPEIHHFETARHDIETASISEAQGTLSVSAKASSDIAWPGFFLAIITLAAVLIVLNRLRVIFRTLTDQNPFVSPNASRIRMIGIVLVAAELTRKGLGAWFAQRVTSEISFAGLTFQGGLSVDTSVIFAGLILLMLAEVFRLGAEMKGDIETARKIQLDLVPGETFHKNDTVIQARMRPAKIVGGDYYDVLELDDRHLAVIVGDVTGKGLSAAMLMASVLGSVRALCSAGLRGSELIAALNKHVSANASGDRLVTLFYGEFDTATGQMTYVNAGHNPPILLRSDGCVERLQPTSLVLGAMPDARIESGNVNLNPADRLLLFTDGFSEAFNKKEEEYGEKRLTESFVSVGKLPLPLVAERLIAGVLSFCGPLPPSDDMTLMLVERQPA